MFKAKFKDISNKFISFAGVGCVGTLGHYTTLVLLVNRLEAPPVFSSSIGFVVGASINYVLNYIFTFKSSKPHCESISKFFIVALVGLLLNAQIMTFMVEKMAFHYLLSQVVATGFVLIWNFTGNFLWTFRERRHAD